MRSGNRSFIVTVRARAGASPSIPGSSPMSSALSASSAVGFFQFWAVAGIPAPQPPAISQVTTGCPIGPSVRPTEPHVEFHEFPMPPSVAFHRERGLSCLCQIPVSSRSIDVLPTACSTAFRSDSPRRPSAPHDGGRGRRAPRERRHHRHNHRQHESRTPPVRRDRADAHGRRRREQHGERCLRAFHHS